MTGQTGSNALRVGVLVVIATALLYAGFVFLGGRVGHKGKHYFVSLTDAGGVVKGTRVSMAGVHIGEVEDVELKNPRLVMVKLEIYSHEPPYKIPEGSVAEIPTQFISLGETGMVIEPPNKILGEAPEGSILVGRHPGPLEALLPDSATTVQTLTETLAAMRDLLKDEDLKGNVKRLLTTTSKTLEQFDLLAANTNKMLGENQGPINSAMRNASLAMADVHKSTTLLFKMVKDGHYPDQVSALLKHLDATSEKAGKLIDSLDSYANDPAVHNSLKTAMDNAVAVSEQGKEIATKTNAMADNGVELTKRAVALTDQAGEVATEAKALLIKIEGLVTKVEGKLDTVSAKVPKSPIGAIHAEVRAVRDTVPNYNRVDANVQIPIFGQTVDAGLFDAFGSNKLNLQLERQLTKNAVLRYGAHAGTEGLGVDYSLAPRLRLSADLFNANKPRWDTLAKYEFSKGYDLWFGFDRIFDRNGLTIGLGIEK